jgi:hypothetical protein
MRTHLSAAHGQTTPYFESTVAVTQLHPGWEAVLPAVRRRLVRIRRQSSPLIQAVGEQAAPTGVTRR